MFSALLIGLFGSGHCLAMCGGIACAPAMARHGNTVLAILLFNSGRLLGYALVGLLAGLIGQSLSVSPLLLETLRTLAGALLVAMGLYVGQWWLGITRVERVGAGLWKHLAPAATRLRQSPHSWSPLALGVLWGWLPCGLVYSALTWSMAQGSATQSALLMAAFGVGTLPSMLSAGLFSYQIRRWLSRQDVRRLAGVLMILMGLWTVPLTQRALGLSH